MRRVSPLAPIAQSPLRIRAPWLELRYRLAQDAEDDVAAEQAARAALPLMRAVILTALPVEFVAVRDQLQRAGQVRRETGAGGQIYLLGSLRGEHVSWEIACALAEQQTAPPPLRSSTRSIPSTPTSRSSWASPAASPPTARDSGTSVAATRVIAYEGGKDTDQGVQPRPIDLASSYNLKQLAAHVLMDDVWKRNILGDHAASTEGLRAHVEPIAAGSKLVAASSSETARLIATVAPRAVAIEMEGAGFLEALGRFQAVSGIVVRGISDLLDGKGESDRRGSQREASANAAAFAFELLSRLESPQ